MLHPATLHDLRTFGSELYGCWVRRVDARFEFIDGLLAADALPSLPYLSLVPLHRRGWGSICAALSAGWLDPDALCRAVAAVPLADGRPGYAVNVSVWPRCDAEASRGRGLYYHPSRHLAGQPPEAGWAYQWVAQLGFGRDSWTEPPDARRVHPTENTNSAAVAQIRRLLQPLPASEEVPLFVFDAGYDSVQLT